MLQSNREPPARGTLFVLSAPSGAGKTTLVRALLARDPALRFSISFTTRPARVGEQDGRDYHFVDEARFRAMADAGEFLEHATVFGNSYGTSRALVEALLATGANVLLEIDWQGARQIRANAPDCRSVFIMPPSVAELERRLRRRATDSDEVIRRRLSQALDDMAHWREFDFVVVNGDLRTATDGLVDIIGGGGAALSTRSPGLVSEVLSILKA
jgi:guanylate kinase